MPNMGMRHEKGLDQTRAWGVPVRDVQSVKNSKDSVPTLLTEKQALITQKQGDMK
jgi:hypothetical protein